MAIPFAYVTATLENSQGTPRVGVEVLFQPLSTPYAVGSEVATSTILSVTTGGSGEITAQKLLQGVYNVVISDADVFSISVPGDSATYDIADLAVNLPTPSGGNSASQVTPGEVQRLFQTSRTVAHRLNGDEAMTYDKLMIFGEGPGTETELALLYQFYTSSYMLCLGNMSLSDVTANFASWNPTGIGSFPVKFLDCLGTKNYSEEIDTVAEYLDYFEFPDTPAEERYYKVSIPHSIVGAGFIDLFVLNSSADEPDGNTQISDQANWLRTELASSTARWKFVMFNSSPFASKAGYSFPNMDWPFADWGVDVVFCAGVKFYEHLFVNGIPYFIVGTFADVFDTIGTAIPTSQYRLATAGFLVCEFNERSLRFYFQGVSSVLSASVYDVYEVFHKDSTKISSSVRIAPSGGIVSTENGIALDYGVSDGRVQSHFSDYIRDNESRLIRLDSIPSSAVIRASGWLKNCMFMVGDDPPQLYYWNKADSSVQKWYPDGLSDVSIHEGAITQLVPPSFSPGGDNVAVGALVYHIDPYAPDPDVSLWVSINGGDFVQATDNPSKIYFGNPRAGKTVISAFAAKVGFADSEISSAQYQSLSDYFRFAEII
jgi:hypothetical protein